MNLYYCDKISLKWNDTTKKKKENKNIIQKEGIKEKDLKKKEQWVEILI